MALHPFTQVDVFGRTGLSGNPLAVVHEAGDLDDARMADFARWTNLSETTFLLPPTESGRAGGADYRVRIWTPAGELPFAGHPTLGSAHAWLAAGGEPARAGSVVQECAAGIVGLRHDAEAGRLAFAAPPQVRSDAPTEEELAGALRALDLEPSHVRGARWIDNGPGWFGLWLDDAATVDAVRPDAAAFAGWKIGIAGPVHEPSGSGQGTEAPADIRVRGFFADGDSGFFMEDPVTGSLNASLGQWLIGEGELPAAYTAQQGVAIGHDGLVHVERVGEDLWVGGATRTVITGSVDL
ncbi:PhzF family phenazine biosynthesis protein [Brevibacterium litoralis]|uniref:PhzF family phenazine biosynthesis protein n=1 Tax=Brevibacterium litoralis TaxID=3138935 RepID=UPI0032EB2A5A